MHLAEAALHLSLSNEMLPFPWLEKLLLDNMLFFFKLNGERNAKWWNRRPRLAVLPPCILMPKQQIFTLESVVGDAKAKSEESSQLLSGSVSAVYALEGETSRLQQTINMHREAIVQLKRSNDEMKESWNAAMTTNHTLRAQLNLAESSFTVEQRDASARLQEDLRSSNELSMCMGREAIWKQ